MTIGEANDTSIGDDHTARAVAGCQATIFTEGDTPIFKGDALQIGAAIILNNAEDGFAHAALLGRGIFPEPSKVQAKIAGGHDVIVIVEGEVDVDFAPGIAIVKVIHAGIDPVIPATH